MDVRRYRESDRDGCLAVLESCCPAATAEFEEYLRNPAGPFFVMDHDDAVVGCGGFHLEPDGAARLDWGMIRPGVRGQGLGRFLLMFRLREIARQGEVPFVRVAAAREAEGFFAKQGFRAAGFAGDRVEMVKKLAVCA